MRSGEGGGASDSVVDHVLGGRAELLVALDDLVHRIQKVLLGHRLPPCPDGEHPRLGANAPDVRSCPQETKKPRNLIPEKRELFKNGLYRFMQCSVCLSFRSIKELGMMLLMPQFFPFYPLLVHFQFGR